MIIYVNYNKQTGQITLDNSDYSGDPEMLIVNSGTIVDNNSGLNFEISFDVTRFQEVDRPAIDENSFPGETA
jgi:hypothetical protein